MRRFRVGAICALALVAVSAVASPALAHSSPAQVAPRGFGAPSQIPWASVGSGWVLTEWGPPAYLVLTDQAGQRYIVLKERGVLLHADLLDWSGTGQSALFDTETNSGRTTLLVLDLRSGAITNSFVIPTSNTDNFQTASFTRPDGYGVVVDTYTTHAILTRYSLGGQAQVAYPSAFPTIGRVNGAWLDRPDGTEIALGAKYGLAIVANNGTALAELRLPGSSYCQPQSWWSATVVLASCMVGVHSESRLFEFTATGGAPRALTRVNVPPDYGDLSGWRVAGHIYVNVASACGYVYLAKLVGAAPIMITVPGVPSSHNSIHVVGATNTGLAVTATIACRGGASLLWYLPASNSSRIVLGPPVTGGGVGVSLAFPEQLG
jgi:hypothetical protein